MQNRTLVAAVSTLSLGDSPDFCMTWRTFVNIGRDYGAKLRTGLWDFGSHHSIARPIKSTGAALRSEMSLD